MEERIVYMWKDQIGNKVQARYVGYIRHGFTFFAVIDVVIAYA